MKKKNSVSDFETHRRQTLLSDFRNALASQSRLTARQLYRETVAAPAPRFWVSEHRAAAVVGHLDAGLDPTDTMYPKKREMYTEIYGRYRALRDQRPDDSILALVSEVVNTGAPEHYMSWQRAKNIIGDEIRRQKALRRKGGDR